MTSELGTATAVEFRTLFRRHPGAVSVVTSRGEGGPPAGFTSTSVISVSAEPPMIAFSVATSSSAWPTIRDTDRVSVSFLGVDQADIAARFATHGIDRFAAGGWRRLTSGELIIERAAAWLSARVLQRAEAGSSRIVVAEVEVIGPLTDSRAPLLYFDREYTGLQTTTDSQGTEAVA